MFLLYFLHFFVFLLQNKHIYVNDNNQYCYDYTRNRTQQNAVEKAHEKAISMMASYRSKKWQTQGE